VDLFGSSFTDGSKKMIYLTNLGQNMKIIGKKSAVGFQNLSRKK
jgi:hypothetical protein